MVIRENGYDAAWHKKAPTVKRRGPWINQIILAQIPERDAQDRSGNLGLLRLLLSADACHCLGEKLLHLTCGRIAPVGDDLHVLI